MILETPVDFRMDKYKTKKSNLAIGCVKKDFYHQKNEV